MGITIHFPWIEKKYSHTLGNLWKLVSHIWELYGFLNSIDFYSKPTVWKYISIPHNIPIVWNFTLSVLYLGFVIIFNFLKNPQSGNDMAFHRVFSFYGNLYIHKHCEFNGFSSTLNLSGSEDYRKSLCFSYFSRTM